MTQERFEKVVSVEGQVLTSAQVMAVRVAVTGMLTQLVEDHEYRDGLGEIGDLYVARLREVERLVTAGVRGTTVAPLDGEADDSMTIDLKAIRERCEAADLLTPGAVSHSAADVPALLGLVDEAAGELLDGEWSCGDGGGTPICPSCAADSYPSPSFNETDRKHKAGCSRDSLLTRLGFPDQPSRDAERARRAKRPYSTPTLTRLDRTDPRVETMLASLHGDAGNTSGVAPKS